MYNVVLMYYDIKFKCIVLSLHSYSNQNKEQVGTALLYIRCRVGYCNGSVKFELNYIKS